MTLPTSIELLDAVIKTTLVLSLAGLVAHTLRRASAARRHLVWTLGVAAALLVPSLRTLAPRWELPLLPADLLASGTALPLPRLLADGNARREAAGGPAASTPATGPQAVPSVAPGDGQAPRALMTTDPLLTLPRLERGVALGLVWLAGSFAVALPLLLGVVRVWWRGRRQETLSSPEWMDLVDEISSKLALVRAVRLVKGGAGSMPMASGLLGAVVRLPEEAERWPEEKRRAVLTHELAHVKRHDCLTQALAHAACVVYWFHPLVWLAARRLRVERERACDDLVLRSGSSGPDYADHLLQVARSLRAVGQPSWAAVAMARPSQLEGRLLAILDPSLDRRGPSKRGALVTAAVAGLLAVSLAGLEPWARPALAALPSVLEPEVVEAKPRTAIRAEGAPASLPAARPAQAGEPAGRAAQAEETTQGPTPTPSAQEPQAAPVTPRADRESKGSVSGRVVAALTEALHDEDGEVRTQAVYSLGQLRAQSSVPALVGALADPEGEVRAQAAFALGEIGAESAVPGLTSALRDKEAEVRQQAVFALGQIRAKSAVEGLISALKDADEEVRQQAAFALGEIRDEKAVPALIAALKDASAEVRQQAAFALGQIGDPSASDALSAALKDAVAEVRRQAAFALGELAR